MSGRKHRCQLSKIRCYQCLRSGNLKMAAAYYKGFCTLHRYVSPHWAIASKTGFRLQPVSVSEYSTRGGICAYILRFTRPSSSIERKWAVSTFCDMPLTDFFNSPNRLVPVSKSRRISIFHRSLISVTVSSTSQCGNCFFIIVLPYKVSRRYYSTKKCLLDDYILPLLFYTRGITPKYTL